MRLAATVALLVLLASPAFGQGLVPAALSSNVDQNGRPIAGGLLYVYANATTTPQTCYQDLGLTIPMTNPIVADNAGRIPLFYCASGQVHLRFTTAAGDVVYDYPTVLVSGASGGGGGGTGGVDPTTILSTGDIKFRQTAETLTGWVKLNGTTIGSASSGASQRANADTQALFSYLWTQCTQNHCFVSGGRGSTAAADFAANKTIQLPEWRDMAPRGLDDMGNTPRGSNVPVNSGGGDTATTPGASGGIFHQTLDQTNLPAIAPTGSVTATSNPTVFGGWTPSGSVSIGGVQNVTGTVAIGGGWTPSGSVAIGGSFTPSGSIGGSATPTITTTIGGSQSLGNILVSSGVPTFSGPASASGGFTAITVNGSNFTGTSSSSTISGASFSFSGNTITASSVIGASFSGNAISANTVISAGFSGGTIVGAGFNGTFTGNPVSAASVIGVNAGTYAFNGNTLGSGVGVNVTDPFNLGTWYMKLATPADLHICNVLSCERHDEEDI